MNTKPAPVTPVTGLGHTSVNPDLLKTVGYVEEANASATSILVDHHVEHMVTHDGQVEVMPLADALVTYPWLQELMFSLVDPTSDEVLRRAFESTRRPLGTFTWVHDHAVLDKPLQSFTLMTVPQERQFMHDVTVIGEGAVVDSISGAAVTEQMTHGTHVSVSETFIHPNARVRSLDVERWGAHMDVHSYSGTKVGAGAVCSTISVAVNAIRSHTDISTTVLDDDAVDTNHSIAFAPHGTHRTMRSTVELQGDGARCEQVARMVSDGGDIDNETTLVGRGAGSSGFLQCDGLMISPLGTITSVPALVAATDTAQLSHEASVGMVDSDRLEYLMSTGLDEDAARDLIVRGFLDVEDRDMPDSLRETVAGLIAAARAGAM
ncbi:SufD family Fe-S cluster assembly protein [Corynebacterium sp.]|uniref:SufD family Fe-S cluster assembly protein n=1 Tax=Corynebacterium sp. TaxID=1720 RepID=UPI0026DD6756|nr:SufD family Fe-S cluster assembly protein [Corynebacterium sp.]MDO5077405.1 SufD family Fe-S cluster assembly protein [Corynebacterium sp.]